MKTFATGLTLLVAIASAEVAPAWTRRTPVHPTHPTVLHAPAEVAGPGAGLARRPHSPNPAWDVYSITGRYLGSDPDPRVRLMLRKDRFNQY